jgi:hypothetical protein
MADDEPKREHHRREASKAPIGPSVDAILVVPKQKPSKSPAFRRARARLAAHALHHKHPDMARDAGRKGGEATSQGYALGKRAWAVAMALRRWHKTPFHYIASRAPEAGPGGEGGGTPEPGPVEALKVERPPQPTNSHSPKQLKLL